MNAKVAKQIRRMVLGDHSQRLRDYGVIPRTGQLVCRGLREKYRTAKKFHMAMNRAGKQSPFLFKGRPHADQKA